MAEFEGAVKAPDFGSIMVLARKIDPQAGVSPNPDRDRASGFGRPRRISPSTH